MLIAYGYARDILGAELDEENRKSAESKAARILLDKILSSVGSPFSSNNIIKGESEKPRFESDDVDFNITHSKGFVACVVSFGEGRVGIDAERISGNVAEKRKTELAERFFSQKERDALLNGESFLSLWTKREAYLKMTGEGFAKGVGREIPSDVFFSSASIDGYMIAVASERKTTIEIFEI